MRYMAHFSFDSKIKRVLFVLSVMGQAGRHPLEMSKRIVFLVLFCTRLFKHHSICHKQRLLSFHTQRQQQRDPPSAYRVDRPTINQAEASVFPSFFSQLKD